MDRKQAWGRQSVLKALHYRYPHRRKTTSIEHPAAPPVLPFQALPWPALRARASLTRTRLSTRTHVFTHTTPSSVSVQTLGRRPPLRGDGPALHGAALQGSREARRALERVGRG